MVPQLYALYLTGQWYLSAYLRTHRALQNTESARKTLGSARSRIMYSARRSKVLHFRYTFPEKQIRPHGHSGVSSSRSIRKRGSVCGVYRIRLAHTARPAISNRSGIIRWTDENGGVYSGARVLWKRLPVRSMVVRWLRVIVCGRDSIWLLDS